MLYTDDTSKMGWYPRGIADYSDPELLAHHFKHPTDSTASIVEHMGPRPCSDKGHRNEWISVVRFNDNLEKIFYVPCKPIVINLDMEKFYTAVELLPMQVPYKNAKDNVSQYAQADHRNDELVRIKKTLSKLNAPQEYISEVESINAYNKNLIANA